MKSVASRAGPRLRVLVVEDELLIAMDMEKLLGELGCTVLGPVPTVAKALALLEREAPDFAILDVNLGRERSTPVAEALLANGVRFALATGYEPEQLHEEVFRGAIFLGKPLQANSLRQALHDLRWPAGPE